MRPKMILKCTLKWLGGLFAAFALYALSFGPALQFTGAEPGKGWGGTNPVIRFVYAPLREVGGGLPMAYEHYILWWLSDADSSTAK